MTDASDPPPSPADVARDAIRSHAEATFGGRDALDAALGWAAGNLGAADRDRLNADLAGPPPVAGRAVQELKAQYTAAQRATADARLRADGVPSTAAEFRTLRARAMRGDANARRALRNTSPGQLAKFLL